MRISKSLLSWQPLKYIHKYLLLNGEGYSADAIKKQLAHNPRNKIRGVCNRAEYLPERRKVLQERADYLDKLQLNTKE